MSAGGGHTVAVLTTGTATSGESVPLAVKTAEPPAGRSTRALIVPAPCVERQTAPGDATQVHVTAVSSIGNVSCTGAPITGLGPAFATVIVYVITWPANAVSRLSVLVIERSATRPASPEADPVLCVGSGSGS